MPHEEIIPKADQAEQPKCIGLFGKLNGHKFTQNGYNAKGWNNGYCEDAHGRLLKHRHKKGTLTFETYEKLFKHFGYSQNISWTFTDKI